MAEKKFVVATFDDENELFPAIEKVKHSGKKIYDVYTPFPVHGLDAALGLRETKLHTAGFIYGAIGTATAVGGMGYVFTKDWPTNFGGKPFWSFPAFIPVTFELTVLFAAVGMVLTFCFLNQIAPGVKKHRFSLRATDDLFVVVVEVNDHNGTEDQIKTTLKNALTVETQIAEAGWWFGTYDK